MPTVAGDADIIISSETGRGNDDGLRVRTNDFTKRTNDFSLGYDMIGQGRADHAVFDLTISSSLLPSVL